MFSFAADDFVGAGLRGQDALRPLVECVVFRGLESAGRDDWRIHVACGIACVTTGVERGIFAAGCAFGVAAAVHG